MKTLETEDLISNNEDKLFRKKEILKELKRIGDLLEVSSKEIRSLLKSNTTLLQSILEMLERGDKVNKE